jgi:serine/threonine protein kinase
MAPEVITSTKYDYKCDVFSFGIIMFQILSQCEDKDIYPPSKEKNVDFLLGTDPNYRPKIKEIYNKNEFVEFIGIKFFFLFFKFFFKFNNL